MSESDDREWLEALAGRRPEVDAPDVREARRLRQAILEGLTAEQHDPPSDDPERRAALIERARREGLLAPRPRGARRRTSALPIAIAATIAGLAAVSLWHWLPSGTEIRRGGPDEIFHLQARDPLQLRRQIIGELRTAGVAATGYESLQAQGIDADLPQPLPPQVERILQKHGIPSPRDGTLRVEISAGE